MTHRNCEFGPEKKCASCAAPELIKGNFFFAARACLCGRVTAPCARNFAAILCQKLGQKGGTPWLGPGRAPRAGKWLQKCSDGAPKSAFQTSTEAGKVMKYSIFSAPGRADSLLEWGGASVRPRAEIFLREGGGCLGPFVLRPSVRPSSGEAIKKQGF